MSVELVPSLRARHPPLIPAKLHRGQSINHVIAGGEDEVEGFIALT
jgi:hypothetical protein